MTSAFCTNCGATLGGGRFCTTCGTPVAGLASETAAEATAPVTADETLADGGVETDLVPRRPQPVPGALPPLSTLPPPVMGLPPLRSTLPPMPQPTAKRSPLPWIAAGAVLALAAGGVTAWLIVDAKHSPTGAPGAAPTVAVSTPGTPVTDAGATTSTSPTTGTDDETTAGNHLRDVVTHDVARHDAYNKALGDLTLYCKGDPISGNVRDLVTTVVTFPADRETFAHRAEVIATHAEPGDARALATRLATLERELADAASYGVTWARTVRGSGNCAPYHREQAYAPQDVSNKRNAWVRDFKTFADANGVDVSKLKDLFLQNGL